ncbi:MAG TPA: divalent metal cation transporter [Ktedonobacteraceae bacterium]|nr:divalent metal cation transporter [Ktedonobacteraceae bacterium]
MPKKQRDEENEIQPGMEVETTQGDLGEEDISKPKVADVVHDQDGDVEKIIVKKGVVFQKELEVPADRIQRVEEPPDVGDDGKVTIETRQQETEDLGATGVEELTPLENVERPDEQDVLDLIEQQIPTTEGVREKESARVLGITDWQPDSIEKLQGQEKSKLPRKPLRKGNITIKELLRMLGPGFLGGMAGNDSSAVTAYAIDGAQNGFGHLWLLLLATFMYQAVQYTCAKLGRVTQRGLADVLREQYGVWIAGFASLILIVVNVALIAADLVAVSSGLQLLIGITWIWFVVPVGAILWYLTVYRNFESLKKIFIAMSLAFVAYIVTGLLAHPNWGSMLFHTVVPQIDFSFASISSAVALLGATISPYSIFWQVQGEKEEQRPGTKVQQIRFAAMDVGTGVISGNLVAYFVIVSTAATLFTQHRGINTAADAAQALVPVLGPFGEYLFALGLIGAGFVAIPILLASTSYAVAGTFGWPGGLSKKPWQSEGFYLIMTMALVVSLIMALLRLDPIRLMFWANVLSGVLVPILIGYLIVLSNSRKIMGKLRIGWATNAGLVLTFLVTGAGTALLFYSLLTGR